ncbi:MAG TPA: hypothetical protein VGI57_11810 [Usitatibacter sp.]|jgi:hypothetical protein
MRILAATLLALFAAAPCLAQRTYAVLSLVGDRIDIVQRAPVVGSAIDRNRKQSLPLSDSAIDRAILAGVDQALKKSEPDAKPVLLLARDPALYKAQDRMLDDSAAVTMLLGQIRPLLAESRATHLVLVTKYRHEATFRMGSGESVGNGMIEGAGFYVDRTLMTKKYGTSERARGFLSPYVYCEVSLIDLATSAVVKNQTILGGFVRSAARGESGEAWDALTDTQKVDLLVRIARGEAFKATTQVIAP